MTARLTDPTTSHEAGASVRMRSGSQRAILLHAYRRSGDLPLSDEQASYSAGVSRRSCWWKRCSELRKLGLIEWARLEDGRYFEERGSAGELVRLSVITEAGLAWCEQHPVAAPTKFDTPDPTSTKYDAMLAVFGDVLDVVDQVAGEHSDFIPGVFQHPHDNDYARGVFYVVKAIRHVLDEHGVLDYE